MKVYLLIAYTMSDIYILGVYSSRKKAKEKENSIGYENYKVYDIIEWEVE